MHCREGGVRRRHGLRSLRLNVSFRSFLRHLPFSGLQKDPRAHSQCWGGNSHKCFSDMACIWALVENQRRRHESCIGWRVNGILRKVQDWDVCCDAHDRLLYPPPRILIAHEAGIDSQRRRFPVRKRHIPIFQMMEQPQTHDLIR